MKSLVLSCVIALALGSPEANAEADAHYRGYGLGVAAHPGYGTSYVGRTVYGYPSYRYGKRSADPEPHGVVAHVHGLGVAGHPGHATSYVGRTIFGYPSHHYGKRSAEATPYGKRSADPEPHGVVAHVHGLGVTGHPGHATSFVGRTIYGYPSHHYGKRSAKATPYGKRSADPEPHGVVAHVHGLGVAGHPGHATSYVGRTIFGYPSHHYGKRSADAKADAHYGGYGYGRYAYGSPYGYGYRRGYHYGKRSAEADPEAHVHYGAYGHGGYAYGVPGGYTRVSGLAPYGYGYGR